MMGIRVHALTVDDLTAAEAACIARPGASLIINHNLHSLYLVQRDAVMRALYARADYIHIDGMALIWLGRLLGFPLRRDHRVTWLDWLEPLMAAAAARGWSVFYLGGKAGIAAKAANRLAAEFPGLVVETASGYFDARPGSADSEALLARINAARPDILMVGMGMPRQEHWIHHHIDRLEVGVVHAPGACFDYVAGEVPRPPRWVGRAGLEWLYRLLSEPRRLWRRYLVEPWSVLGLFLRELLRRRSRRSAD